MTISDKDVKWLKEQMNRPVHGGVIFNTGYDAAVEKFNDLISAIHKPRYHVIIKGRSSFKGDNALFLYKRDGVVYAGDNIKAFNADKDNKKYHFTEQEIKDYDERYWAFALPVEEPEE